MDSDFVNEFNRRIDALPAMIENVLAPKEINGSSIIYKGKFRLRLQTRTIELDGEIYFSYRPNPGVRFKGDSNYYNFNMFVEAIEIDNMLIEHGNSMITHIGHSDHFL